MFMVRPFLLVGFPLLSDSLEWLFKSVEVAETMMTKIMGTIIMGTILDLPIRDSQNREQWATLEPNISNSVFSPLHIPIFCATGW